MAQDDSGYIDPNTVAYLAKGWQAVIAIGPDGVPWPFLYHPDGDGDGAAVMQMPEHELEGPLSPEMVTRIRHADPGRCRATVAVRRRCVRPVRDGGAYCWQHLQRHSVR